MIEPKEISKAAALHKVSSRQIEKDYVLSWVLFAISKNLNLKNALVFKGGTVLKKAYFNDYRFSEDLDFTLIREDMTNKIILDEFEGLLNFIKEEANIDMQMDKAKCTIQESGSLQFYIDYAASLKGNIGSRDLKIDITRGEVLETSAVNKSLIRTYSDLNEDFHLLCYSLEEVLIEKMTALMGRTEPRDLYDFWYLTEVERLDISGIYLSFKNKAGRKKHDPNNFLEKLLSKEAVFKRDWKNKLTSQIHDLPEFEKVFRAAKRQGKF